MSLPHPDHWAFQASARAIILGVKGVLFNLGRVSRSIRGLSKAESLGCRWRMLLITSIVPCSGPTSNRVDRRQMSSGGVDVAVDTVAVQLDI